MKYYILLSLLIVVSLAIPSIAATQNQTSGVQPIGSFLLNGSNLIKAPEVSLITPGFYWTYPYINYPIYSEGQRISGYILGTNQQAGTNVRLCASDFNLSKFLNGSAEKIANGNCDTQPIKLNDTGDGIFALEGQKSGTYMLLGKDELNSTILSMMPLIITAQDISVNSSAKMVAGGILKAAIKMRGFDNLTKYYGAILVSSKDYESIKLDIVSNGSQKNLSSIIAFGNRSMTIQGLPSISMDLLMKLSTILPQNAAIAMEKSSKPGVEFSLVSDPGWEHGSYILTCIVYSPGKGILGIRQIPVEVD
ncbi:MAG: TIGR04279 domain-containing protein [Methanotrichaceae archaeon]